MDSVNEQALNSRLLGLPTEILLNISDKLSPVDKVLFSLSSKRLRAIHTKYFDLSLDDEEDTLELLLLLEKDLPDYLTCRKCAWMFKWKPRKSKYYRCPRADIQFDSDHDLIAAPASLNHLVITQEVKDLIVRGVERGPNHGLPASYLNHECDSTHSFIDAVAKDPKTHFNFEGRVHGKDFILASSCDFVVPIKSLRSDPLFFGLCKHSTTQLRHVIGGFKIEGKHNEPLHCGTMRCDSCLTDFKITKIPHHIPDQVVLKLRVWRKFSSSSPAIRPTRCCLGSGGDLQQNRTGRDLECDFNASKSTRMLLLDYKEAHETQDTCVSNEYGPPLTYCLVGSGSKVSYEVLRILPKSKIDSPRYYS